MAFGGNGILGKFQQRLKNIRINRAKKKKMNEEFLEEKVKEIHKIVENEPNRIVRKGVALVNEDDSPVIKKQDVGSDKIGLVIETVPEKKDDVERVADDPYVQGVVEHIHELDLDVSSKKAVLSSDEDNVKNNTLTQENDSNNMGKNSNSGLMQDKQVVQKAGIQVEEKKQSLGDVKDYGFHPNKKVNGPLSDEDRKKKIDSVKEDLLVKIQLSFDDCIDELDVLESELYLLSSKEEYALTVEKIKKIKSKINEYVTEINQLIDIYNSYNKKYFNGSIADIDDDVIADDLISFRMLLENQSDEKKFVGEIKNLESFQKLYQRLQEIKGNVESLREDANRKQGNFEERDKKYHEILEGALNASTINKSCVDEINKQNEYYGSLMERIHDIHSSEYVTTHLRGLGDLVDMSLRYVGLLLLNPLRNTIPGIGIQTIATRRLVGNLYRRLHFEEVRHIHYEAVDYDNEINKNLTDVHYMSSLIDDTLGSVEKLRSDFMMQYDSKIPGYSDTLMRLDDLYYMVQKNQKRLNIIEKNLNYGKRVNEEKLVRVRELNEHE